jgi:hypothetical protein
MSDYLLLPRRTELEARADIAAAELRRQIAIENNRLWRMLFADAADIREEAIKQRAAEYASEPAADCPDIDDSDKVNRMRQPYLVWTKEGDYE